MADINLKLELRISQSVIRWGLSALLLACCAPELASESVTLNTYYPAPSGVYTQMITTTNNWMARDSGSMDVGMNQSTSNNVMTVHGNATFNHAIQGPFGLIPGRADWGSYGTGYDGAAIYNDGGGYQKLMIVGNSSAGGNRLIGMWDDVQVYGNLTVNSNETVSGNQTVSGNSSIGGSLTVGGPLQVNNQATITGNLYAQQGVQVGASIAARQAGCFLVHWSVNGTNTGLGCGGGYYVTNQSGFYSEWMTAPTGPYTNPGPAVDGTAFCCPDGAIGAQF